MKRLIFLSFKIILFGNLILPFLFPYVLASIEGKVTIAPTDDTYTDVNNPNANYGGQTTLEIEMFWEGNPYEMWKKRVWLKFNLSEVPDGAVVDNATLELHSSVVTETYDIGAYSCASISWTELTLTWDNSPAFGTLMDKTLVASSAQWYSWNVTDAVLDGLNGIHGGPDVVPVVLREATTFRSMYSKASFLSKEGSSELRPKLTIHWIDVIPEFPSLLLLPLFMMVILLAAIAFRRKQKVRPVLRHAF